MPAKRQLVNRHPWLMALAALVVVQLASSGTLRGPALSAFADLLQFTIMLLMVVGTAINIAPNRGVTRAFWVLMTLSALMWAADYGFWVYYEVFRRTAVPVPQPGDAFLILHVIPIMMALAMLPHQLREEGSALLSHLELGLIACWWMYLYFQFVFVWQYLRYDPPAFHRNFNLLYHAELGIAVLGFLYLSQKAGDGWQGIFNHYLIAFLIYAPTSAIINILIQQGIYVSGGVWDLPLTVSIAYIAWIGFHARSVRFEPQAKHSGSQPRIAIPGWVAGLAMASIPAIALFSFERLHDPAGVRHFRIALSFTAMLAMAVLIFTRQQLLNDRLAHLLDHSTRAYENLERLQTQMAQSEKLASIGKLVSGTAHELNNPLTAILGYAELIAHNNDVPGGARGFAEKIAHQAHRTKSLVESLLSFARQTSSSKRLTDLNSLATNASQLRMATLPANITLLRDLQPDLALVTADGNQMLQVLLHLLSNAVDALEEAGGGQLIVRTRNEEQHVVLEICDTGTGISEPSRVFDPFYTTKSPGQGTGLGLSACYGIIQEHEGKIECFNLQPRGAIFRITLAAAKQMVTETVAAS